MPPAHRVKPPTKGAKQIVAENEATVIFYRNMALGSTAFYMVTVGALDFDGLTLMAMIMNGVMVAIYLGCLKMMHYISRPRYSDNSQIIDAGLDLNMEGGMGEHVKDMVILTSITHVMAAVSNYFWCLLMLLPLRVIWLVWVNILGPWFFQEAPEETEQDEKKRRKLERKRQRC